jgi:REP element-mobilizing transposase RayT
MLGVPVIAELVVEALFYFHCIRYLTYALVVMPNHVHWLMRPLDGLALSDIIKSVKGSTAYLINRNLGRKGTIWMPDYFDRYIRDSEHFSKAVRYIENNPVKAGLCVSPEEWPYSSANPELRIEEQAGTINLNWREEQRFADKNVRVPFICGY